ncbi:Probable GTP diphosphokinase CRSH, chloroplastic [Linum grandiflorum]
MDAEVLSASILWHVLEAGAISLKEVRNRVGPATALLLHETWRLKTLPTRLEVIDDDDDDDAASTLRRFCLTYYDIRALVLDLALKLDMMRNLDYLPRHQQLMVSLQVMRLHAPLAHAVGTHSLSLELEDLSFSYLFPYSYLYVDAWLNSHETGSRSLMDEYALRLHHCLRDDPLLVEMVDDVSVKGRYKSRYSTMKKLLKDGRKPEQVNDVLGLRVILHPKEDLSEKACYRTREIIRSLWKDIPDRTKDYIAKPKANGYQSLHMAVDVSDEKNARPMMEIQIRTVDMDRKAVGGAASHSLYKAGLTDAEEAKRLKTIMMAAAEFAALRLKDLPSAAEGIEIEGRDRVFGLLDKNGDGRISIEELMEVMEELGAPGKDAEEMMQLLDSNSDGSLNSDEFDSFQKQVELIRDLEQQDDSYKSKLKQKLEATEENGLIQVYSKELGNRLAQLKDSSSTL